MVVVASIQLKQSFVSPLPTLLLSSASPQHQWDPVSLSPGTAHSLTLPLHGWDPHEHAGGEEADGLQAQPKRLSLWSLQGAVIECTVPQLQPADGQCPRALVSLAGKPPVGKRGCVAAGASRGRALQQVLQGFSRMLLIPGHGNTGGFGAVNATEGPSAPCWPPHCRACCLELIT